MRFERYACVVCGRGYVARVSEGQEHVFCPVCGNDVISRGETDDFVPRERVWFWCVEHYWDDVVFSVEEEDGDCVNMCPVCGDNDGLAKMEGEEVDELAERAAAPNETE